jgi:beta-ribofuranosylaminobenzene 5'-phosphate synthase
MSRVVRVIAPSRLHFGLWSLGGEGRQFGGVGTMIDRPALEISMDAAAELVATGAHASRTIEFARRWAEFHSRTLPPCRIAVHHAIPEHAGLGSGTQHALAVAAGLNAFCGLPCQTPQELALSVGRGLRSAVGTYGFVFGGLIVEQGKLPDEPISPLDCRIDLPDDWRFVLARPHGLTGLAGEDEADAFQSLLAVPPSVREELIGTVRDRLVPAAALGDFDEFAESLHRYGRLSGECFAARQGGPYNGPVVTALVEQIRSLGYVGVGQSSWGPTIFVVTQSYASAERLTEQIRSSGAAAELDLIISSPCNKGAQIDINHAKQREPV